MTTWDKLHRIEFRGIPLRLWHESRVWFEGLRREFDIIAAETHASTPRELVDLVAQTSQKFSRFSEDSNALMEQAWQKGQRSIDVELELPAEAAQASRDLWDHIIAADEFCREGDLLTMQLEDEPRRFIRWYLDEVVRQIEGGAPRPWAG